MTFTFAQLAFAAGFVAIALGAAVCDVCWGRR